MMCDKFEQAFEEFLESKEYDLGEEALFAMARKGFFAGWRAAGGHVMSGQSVKTARTKYDVLVEKSINHDVICFPKD